MNCAEIRRLPWLIRLLTSALLAALVLTPAPLALSASRTRPLSMLLLVLTAVLAKVLAPLVQSSRNNHSVPNPLCSVCCAGDFLMQKFIGQYRIIPALRLKHRFGGCGTASALPKCSIMSGCGTRIVLRGQKPLALCDRCPCFGSLLPPLAALTFAASSIICAFGLAAAAPRSPYRHLELCGIAIDDLIQALYPAAELFLLLWYRAFALFYTLYGTLTHFTERLQGTAKNVQFFTQTIRQHGRYRLNFAVQ